MYINDRRYNWISYANKLVINKNNIERVNMRSKVIWLSNSTSLTIYKNLYSNLINNQLEQLFL